MPPRPAFLTLTPGEIADIEQAAAAASASVAHLRDQPVNRATHRCGHRTTTACTDLRCTVPVTFVAPHTAEAHAA